MAYRVSCGSTSFPWLVAIDVISKAEIGDCSASSADSAFVIFEGVCKDTFQKYVVEGG